ncbi:hypothetical protein ACFLRF_04635 [Candidatus Altiarchaeota archaeon]
MQELRLRSLRRALKGNESLVVFISFLLLFALVTHKVSWGWNDLSRFATIESIVEEGTLQIDDSSFFNRTGDKYYYNGHYYSDKPPILQIAAAPVYYSLWSDGFSFVAEPKISQFMVTFLTIGVLSSLGLVFFNKSLHVMGVEGGWRGLLTLIAGTGTLVFPYSGIFNNHVVSGALLMIAFYHLLRIGDGVRYAVVAGVMHSLAGSIDFTTFIFIPFALIVFHKRPLKLVVAFLIGTIPLTLTYFSITMLVSGSILPPGLNTALWDYPGSIFDESNLSGVARHGSLAEVGVYTFHMLAGNRGLFSHTPILLVSIYALLRVLRQDTVFRGYYRYITLASAAFILSYILMSNNYSGGAYGVRWFTSIMLIGMIPLAGIRDAFRDNRVLRLLFIFLAALSILVALIGTAQPWAPVHDNMSSITECIKVLAEKSPIFRIKTLVLTVVIYTLFFSYCMKIFNKEG